jgi:hypothetical protein
MLHENITVGDVHYIQNWSVADNTARDALSVAAADVGKVCQVTGTSSYYILTDDSPMTWQLIGSGGSSNSFSTIAVSGQSDIVADSSTDTLTIAAGSNITITTNAGTDTLTIASSGGGGTTIPAINGFRLTLTTGVPVTTSDVATSSTLYCTPYKGNQISLYDGVSAWTTVSSVEFSLALSGLTANLPYDVFCYNNAGTATLEFTAWTNATTRATALTYQDGILVKTGATTRRYLGTFYTISTTETCDTARQRFLWNYYNRAERKLKVTDTTDSWNYSTAAYRQANNSATNQIEVVVGVFESFASFTLIARAINSTTASANCAVGIGVNSTTTNSADILVNANCTNTIGGQPTAFLSHGVSGYTYYVWLEYGNGSLTQTWYGDSGVAFLQTGMLGNISC